MIIRVLLGLGAVLMMTSLTIKGVERVADWHQWVIDNAYNKGRAMERLCGANGADAICEKHRRDIGHNLRANFD